MSAIYGQVATIRHSCGVEGATLLARMRALEREALRAPPAAGEVPKAVRLRRLLVDWISEIGEDFRMASATIHAAVQLMDRFLARMDVHRSRYQLVAMSCFLIAAKFEEAEENVPSAHAVNQYANEAYQPRLLHHMEILILRTLDWSLTATTALHFLGAFHAAGILFSSDTMAYRPLVADVPRYLQRYTDFFADLALQEYSFQQHLPSHLAAAIVLAARKSLVIRPLWTPELTELTGSSEAELLPLMTQLWENYVEQFPSESSTQESSASDADRRALASGRVLLNDLPPHASLFAAQAHRAAVSPTAAATGRASPMLLTPAGAFATELLFAPQEVLPAAATASASSSAAASSVPGAPAAVSAASFSALLGTATPAGPLAGAGVTAPPSSSSTLAASARTERSDGSGCDGVGSVSVDGVRPLSWATPGDAGNSRRMDEGGEMLLLPLMTAVTALPSPPVPSAAQGAYAAASKTASASAVGSLATSPAFAAAASRREGPRTRARTGAAGSDENARCDSSSRPLADKAASAAAAAATSVAASAAASGGAAALR